VKKYFLVTTALEETWDIDQSVLFLGDWCLRYSRKDHWSNLDSMILPYHWDDRDKLYSDYQYVQDFYERLLIDLSSQLNDIHDVNHNVRYWRILIGPWLAYFVQMLFDRWATVFQAVNECDISSTIILTGHEDALVPNDMSEFIDLHVQDEWNHYIYSEILKNYTMVNCINQDRKKIGIPVPEKNKHMTTWKVFFRRGLVLTYSSVARLFCRNQDAFFINTYLSTFIDVAKLQLRFSSVPQQWVSEIVNRVDVNWDKRNWIVKGKNHSEFEVFVRALIAKQIPKTYLEGYTQLNEQVVGLPWPKQPRVIFTSNSYSSDDVFKAWAALKVENGSPLVIGQHGGLYGVGRWVFAEKHEVAISDAYLSWGWTDKDEPKVKPVGQLQSLKPLEISHNLQNKALMVTCSMPRQSYHMYSGLVSRQWLDYFNDQCEFVKHLPLPIYNSLTVRMYRMDYGWDQEQRWHDRFPDLHLDDGSSSMMELISQSRIYICTYNATTFLESFVMNVPTVIYWNPEHWELRDSARPYFEDLIRVGILHKTPQSAVSHVALIWDDVDQWWKSNEVQDVLARFSMNYCDTTGNLLDRVENVLNDTILNNENK
jgi:putative transferase (TIGR04331 family)